MTIFGSLPILSIPVLAGGGLTTLYNKVMQDFESINSMVPSDFCLGTPGETFQHLRNAMSGVLKRVLHRTSGTLGRVASGYLLSQRRSTSTPAPHKHTKLQKGVGYFQS